jgi:hypothetical protein
VKVIKTTIMVLAATVTCLASTLATAQTQENQIFIYATYFHCNSGTVDRADDAVGKLFSSELGSMINRGSVNSWGWLSKSTGGEWARMGYLTGPSLNGVLNAVDEFKIKIDSKPPVRAFEDACSFGEDYVWHVLAGNDARGRRGPVAFSTYYVCDQARETQADALIKRVIGPMYDKLVAEHKLTTWLWAEHIVGGKYRRLATITAESRDSLIAAREALVAAAEHDPLDEAMTSICGSHQDYIWQVKEQGP